MYEHQKKQKPESHFRGKKWVSKTLENIDTLEDLIFFFLSCTSCALLAGNIDHLWCGCVSCVGQARLFFGVSGTVSRSLVSLLHGSGCLSPCFYEQFPAQELRTHPVVSEHLLSGWAFGCT